MQEMEPCCRNSWVQMTQLVAGVVLEVPLMISSLPWKSPEGPIYPFSLGHLDRRGPGIGLEPLEVITSRAPFPHGNSLQTLHSSIPSITLPVLSVTISLYNKKSILLVGKDTKMKKI